MCFYALLLTLYTCVAHGVLTQLVNGTDVDVNFVDATNGRPALMVCGLDPQSYETLDADCAAIATMLLKRGARRGAPDYRGWTPLQFGASRGLTKYCEVLLQWDSQGLLDGVEAPEGDSIDNLIDAVDPTGRTAAMLAAVNGHFGTVSMLISNGANLTIQNSDGQTALHLATSRAISNSTTKLLGQYEAFVDVVSQTKGLIDARDKDNRTALMYAAMALNHRVVDILLIHRADPTLVDRFKTSVMAMCSKDGTLQERVITAQMDVIERQHDGWLDDTEHIIKEYERQVALAHEMDLEQARLEKMGFQPVGRQQRQDVEL